MAEKFNAKCAICGTPYKVCRSCAEKNLESWKQVCDTEECFDVFTVLYKYGVIQSITKDKAKELLEGKIKELSEYPAHIKAQLIEVGFVDKSKVEPKVEEKATTISKKETVTKETKAYTKKK